MMAARDVLKNINLFVDGRGYAGQISEYNAPELTLVTEDFRAGGMDVPVTLDMGMEPLETSFSLISYDRDVLALFGVAEGKSVPLTVRGALESWDGTVTPVVHHMRGKITKISRGAWTPGQKAELKITMRLDYYREEHGGQPVHEIDVINMIRKVNGEDRLEGVRQALSI
ncbi:phage major tail tube protein [Haematospirillum sp. H1815]|nr:phage major tail tube protein [Haematospirillum sp. H1815]